MRNHSNRKPHEGEDRSHPARVASGKVVIDRHHVDTAAAHGVDGGAERPNERLSFAGAHLRDLSLMQHDGAKNLLVIWAHASGAARSLACSGKNLGQLLIECCLERFAL